MLDSTARELLASLQSVLAEAASPFKALKTILRQAVAQTGAERGLLVEVDAAGEMAFRVLYRFDPEDLQGASGNYSRGLLQRVMESGQSLRLDDAASATLAEGMESVLRHGFRSILCVPILVDGRVAAILHLEHEGEGRFGEAHERLLVSLAELAASALGALRAGERVLDERNRLRQAERVAREEVQQSREVLAEDWSFGRFLGRSRAVRDLESLVVQAARVDAPVLISGETGTGKNILARVLHHAGRRSKHAIVTVFCPSLEKGMVETELFGHRRGAFTGAVSDRIGKVQVAERGSLFLDEIGELPLDIQPKLLRLLQERTYERVGDATEREADVRVIAATNRDLERQVAEGRFRQDLFERLNFVRIHVPPLRERREDIPLLLRHCLDRQGAGRWVELTADAERFLCEADVDWSGNVRHLDQLAARIAMSGIDEPLDADDLQRLLGVDAGRAARTTSAVEAEPAPTSFEDGLPAMIERQERAWLHEAMRRYPGLSRAELADKLGISESALYKKLRRYGITR